MSWTKRFSFKSLTLIFLLISLNLISISQCHGHGHDHGHAHDEPASFKYSQEANEPPAHGHAHGGHDHTHGGHGHAHGGHGHTHGDHGHAHSHGGEQHAHSHNGKAHGHSHDEQEKQPKGKAVKNTGIKLWIEAITATAVISISPVFILLFIPLDNTEKHQPLLKILLSFASGGLLGDAFLHLIPHAVSPHSHGGDDHGHTHSHSHDEGGHSHDMSVGLWVLAGIIAFLMVEKFVRIVKGDHAHSHAPPKKETKEKDKKEKSDENKSSKETTDKKTDKVVKTEGKFLLLIDLMHGYARV